MNIEALAREAGFYMDQPDYDYSVFNERLSRFAHLIREAVVQELVGAGVEPVTWAKFSAKGKIFDLLEEPDNGAVPLYLHPAPVNQQLLSALNAMLTYFGMDEDEWSKPTFDQARAAIAAAEWKV